MHAFVTRHKIIVIAILLLSVFSFLGLYAKRWLADDGARPMSQPFRSQSFGEGRSLYAQRDLAVAGAELIRPAAGAARHSVPCAIRLEIRQELPEVDGACGNRHLGCWAEPGYSGDQAS